MKVERKAALWVDMLVALKVAWMDSLTADHLAESKVDWRVDLMDPQWVALWEK